MSNLEKLMEAGLDTDLEALFEKFLVKSDDEKTADSLRSVVDENGLKAPKTMKLIGELQRKKKINPGLYKEFVALQNKLASAPAAEGDEPTSEEPEVDEKEKEVAEEKDNVVQLSDAPTDVSLTDKDEEKIKEKMAKIEEKMRERLMAREQKLRERLQNQAAKRAQRQGMKLETLQAIKERKEKIAVLREEIKERREAMKTLREEIKELKPKREKKKKEGEEDKKDEKAKAKAKDKKDEKAKAEAKDKKATA